MSGGAGSGGEEGSGSSSGSDSDSGLDLVMYRWADRQRSHSRDKAAWKQRSQALPPMQYSGRSSGNSSGGGSGRRRKPAAGAAAAGAVVASSAGSDSDDGDALHYDRVQRHVSDGGGVTESRTKVSADKR